MLFELERSIARDLKENPDDWVFDNEETGEGGCIDIQYRPHSIYNKNKDMYVWICNGFFFYCISALGGKTVQRFSLIGKLIFAIAYFKWQSKRTITYKYLIKLYKNHYAVSKDDLLTRFK